MMEFDMFSILNSGQYLIIWRIQFHFIIIRIPFQFLSLTPSRIHGIVIAILFFGRLSSLSMCAVHKLNRDVHVHLDHTTCIIFMKAP